MKQSVSRVPYAPKREQEEREREREREKTCQILMIALVLATEISRMIPYSNYIPYMQ
jgi:hypothetical protein